MNHLTFWVLVKVVFWHICMHAFWCKVTCKRRDSVSWALNINLFILWKPCKSLFCTHEVIMRLFLLGGVGCTAMGSMWFLEWKRKICKRKYKLISGTLEPWSTSDHIIYACSDSAMLLLSCACLCNNSKWDLPLLVSPSSCSVLLLQCFLLKVCTMA